MGSEPRSTASEDTTIAVDEPSSVSAPIAASAPADVPVRRLGRIALLERVGEGGMGVVFRAYDPKLGREVAIKLVSVHHVGDRSGARLLREAQALAQLTHPNVVPIYDVEEIEGRVFIVMEYIAGSTLRDWMNAGPRPWPDVVDKLRQAGEGLAAAHAAGLVHRDFKPG